MKKSTISSLVLLKEIDKLKSDDKFSTIIKLKYNTSSFKSVGSVGNLYRKLSNGKITLLGLSNNREWFKKHGCTGVYYYRYSQSEIEIYFFIKSLKKLNELELKSRIVKILKPKEIEVKFDEPAEFVNYFSDLSIIESGFQFFGNPSFRDEIKFNSTLKSFEGISPVMQTFI